MSELNIFLVPADEPSLVKREVADAVQTFLTECGIINGFYDEENGWFAAGSNSGNLFGDTSSINPTFLYAIVYDQSAAHFVPDSHTGSYGTKCVDCRANLDKALYKLLNKQGEGKNAKDISQWEVICPNCGIGNSLTMLDAKIATAVTRFYINFCCVDTADINPSVLVELERIVGSPLRIILELL